MSRQQEFLKERVIEQLDKMIAMLKAGATVSFHKKSEKKNIYGLDVRISYDDKIKTRAKILFPPEENV